MKFNKSTDSDFWYVSFDNDLFVGKIYNHGSSIDFESQTYVFLGAKQLIEIGQFMQNIERESGTDTTSTFTSNSEWVEICHKK